MLVVIRSPAIKDVLGGKTESTMAHMEKCTKEVETKETEAVVQDTKTFHVKGIVNNMGKPSEKILPILGKDNLEDNEPQKEGRETTTQQDGEPKFEFKVGSSLCEGMDKESRGKESKQTGPMAMTFTNEMG